MAGGRKAEIKRTTRETDIQLELNLDGSGKYEIDTGVPFFDHMMDLFAKHGNFDLKLKAKGDVEVDFHHTVEDVGICLGQAFGKAIGDGGGITRYGQTCLPMQESLCLTALDICGRGFLVYRVEGLAHKVGQFDVELAKDFFQAFSSEGKITLHISLLYGDNQHHIIEAMFKAVARALRQAVAISGDPGDIPSTKGVL